MVTTRGPISAAWSCAPAHSDGLCASVTEDMQGKASVTLSCPAGTGTIDNISYAVYGTPNGTCAGSATVPFTDWNCTKHVESIFKDACVGKENCTLTVDNHVFGPDPCFDVPKHVSVAATGCTSATLPRKRSDSSLE